MKRITFCLLAMVVLLGACTNDEHSVNPEQNVEVVFNLDIKNASATRSISDGSGATQLMYGIFNDAGELIISKVVKDNITSLLSDDGYSMSISLVKGQSYKAAFWAQNPKCTAYTVSEDMQLSIDYAGLNNDELRDAFYGVTEVFRVEGDCSVSAVLKRPFAQVNVGAFPFDLEHAKELGVDIAASAVTILGVADKLDMFTGEVSGEVEVSYSLNAIPTEELKVDADDDGYAEAYSYLSMSYILASTASSTHDMAFTFAELDGSNPVDFSEGLDFVPICRNWRTNILGQMLTGDILFNVKIDPAYEDETINTGGLYYNFSEDVLIKDKEFVFNTYADATFTTENNTLVEVDNVTFAGNIGSIAFGEYRDKGTYNNYTNVLNNVTAKDMVVTHSIGIINVATIDYMAPLFFFRGVSTITNSTFTGTTSTAPQRKDPNGEMHDVLPYDCGVPNACSATFDNCTIDNLYVWSHSHVDIKNSKVKYIRCSVHDQKESSRLTIYEGSEIEEIFVTSSGQCKLVTVDGVSKYAAEKWAPSLTIKAGAKVKLLDMNGRPSLNSKGEQSLIIEEGAIIEKLINAVDEIPNAPTTTI